jgi:uncharacterized protein
MSKSKIYLLDVNVLLALVAARHQHHGHAAAFAEQAEESQLALCRITQMGLLRLLTNKQVLAEDTLNAKEAWAIYEALSRDPRFKFLDEPRDLDQKWRELSETRGRGPSRWTDDYLIAFAQLRGLKLVTLDAALLKRASGSAQLI